MSLLRALRAYVGLGPEEGPDRRDYRSDYRTMAYDYGASKPKPAPNRTARVEARTSDKNRSVPSEGQKPQHRPRSAVSRDKPVKAEPKVNKDEGQDSEIDLSNGDYAVVRSMEVGRKKPKTVVPDSFADAKVVADDFKTGVPVVLNLQSVERELARRLIDFASGLCYALDGTMEKLASQVFLIIPEGVEVLERDRERIEQRGYAR